MQCRLAMTLCHDIFYFAVAVLRLNIRWGERPVYDFYVYMIPDDCTYGVLQPSSLLIQRFYFLRNPITAFQLWRQAWHYGRMDMRWKCWHNWAGGGPAGGRAQVWDDQYGVDYGQCSSSTLQACSQLVSTSNTNRFSGLELVCMTGGNGLIFMGSSERREARIFARDPRQLTSILVVGFSARLGWGPGHGRMFRTMFPVS